MPFTIMLAFEDTAVSHLELLQRHTSIVEMIELVDLWETNTRYSAAEEIKQKTAIDSSSNGCD